MEGNFSHLKIGTGVVKVSAPVWPRFDPPSRCTTQTVADRQTDTPRHKQVTAMLFLNMTPVAVCYRSISPTEVTYSLTAK